MLKSDSRKAFSSFICPSVIILLLNCCFIFTERKHSAQRYALVLVKYLLPGKRGLAAEVDASNINKILQFFDFPCSRNVRPREVSVIYDGINT